MNEKTPKETAHESRRVIGARMFAPSTARNKDAIAKVFLARMPKEGVILEIGSGTGEHAATIAGKLPGVEWRPGDPDEAARRSIDAWRVHSGLANIAAPHEIDVTRKDWTEEVAGPLAGIVSMNMIHIAPFTAAQGVIEGAGRLLGPGGKLFFYGPFSRDGEHTAPSNAAFDESLKSRNPLWGVRDLEGDILPLTEKAGLTLEAVIPMPANNFSVIFRRD